MPLVTENFATHPLRQVDTNLERGISDIAVYVGNLRKAAANPKVVAFLPRSAPEGASIGRSIGAWQAATSPRRLLEILE